MGSCVLGIFVPEGVFARDDDGSPQAAIDSTQSRQLAMINKVRREP
jgi:hypothetical protein